MVTNDFPPKVGGIQSYLWELWRRLPPDDCCVLTTSFEGASDFDARQDYRVERIGAKVMVPTPGLGRKVHSLADEHEAEVVILDPALPLGWLGPRLRRRYALVLHGAEIGLPGRSRLTRGVLSDVLRRASFVISAGGYPLAEAERAARRPLRHVMVPPGVDSDRFSPLDPEQRAAARRRFGLGPGPLVLGVSRLVPRKGYDVLIEAVARLAATRPDLGLAIAGDGRERARLQRLANRLNAPVVFLGRVPDADLPDLYGCADVFAMLCHDRWMGMEREGFGIVFLEAAAAGIPQIAGRSGGSHEAVSDGETGVVVDRPTNAADVADAVAGYVDDPELAAKHGHAARRRAVEQFDYDHLAEVLRTGMEALVAS